MKRALVIGTGRIALGVAGELLHDAGWHVTFAGRNANVVERLHRAGAYRLRLRSRDTATVRVIDGIDAVDIGDAAALRSLVLGCDLVVTAVGSGNLDGVAALLAAPLSERTRRVDVLAFENLASPGAALRAALDAHDPLWSPHALVGCAGALVARAVTQVELDGVADALVTVTGEPVRDVAVEAAALTGPLPLVDGLHAVADFEAHVRRKLFVFSAGHATAAYLGQLKGYRFVHAAVRDPEIRRAVLAAMREGQAGVAARYGAAFAAYAGAPAPDATSGVVGDDPRAEAALEAIVDRFANAALGDPVARVGRDPRRKLATDDRLMGAAQFADGAGLGCDGLLLAAAAALCFESPADPSAAALGRAVDRHGAHAALVQQCGLPERSRLGRAVADAWQHLTGGLRPTTALLSLDRRLWA